jgi:hypothetical protein
MTTKTELLMKQIKMFSEKISGVEQPKVLDTTPRFRDGSARDPLTRAEETTDLERALSGDMAYFTENTAGVLNILRLRQERGAEEREEENNQLAKERIGRKMTDLDRVKAEKEAKQARFEAWQAESVTRRIDGLAPLPMPPEVA